MGVPTASKSTVLHPACVGSATFSSANAGQYNQSESNAGHARRTTTKRSCLEQQHLPNPHLTAASQISLRGSKQ